MKRRIFNHLVVVATTLVLMPSAWATWSSFKSLGKTSIVGEPACAQLASKEVVCVTRSQTSTLMANEFNKKWLGWTDLGDTVTSDAACTPDGAGDIVCAAASATSTLTATVFNGTSWSALVDSGVAISSVPTCALIKVGKVLCAARSVSGSLSSSVFKAGAWGKFSTETASLVSAPNCTSDDDGNVICAMYAMGTDGINHYMVNLFDGLKWQGFLTLAGYWTGNPVCVADGQDGSVEGGVFCFSQADNTGVYGSAFNGNGWSIGDWNCDACVLVSGNVLPTFSCSNTGTYNVTCAFLNMQDHLMYSDNFNGTNWTGYAKVGKSPIIGGPVCTPYAKGSTVCVVVGINSQASSTTGP